LASYSSARAFRNQPLQLLLLISFQMLAKGWSLLLRVACSYAAYCCWALQEAGSQLLHVLLHRQQHHCLTPIQLLLLAAAVHPLRPALWQQLQQQRCHVAPLLHQPLLLLLLLSC
jgi:hypothetical protein